jgi:hypothetical protein
MATGQKKGKMIALWGTQSCCGLSFSIRLRGLNRYSVRASKHGRSGSVFGSYTCLGNLA